MKSIFAIATLLIISAAANAQPVGDIYIRGLRYNDHSRNASMSPTSLTNGGTISVYCSSVNFSMLNNSGYRFTVALQDVNRGDGYGVTAFQLRSVRVNGNMLYVDVPFDAMYNYLRNRTFYLTVTIIGPQPWHYVYPGTITLR